MTRFLSFLRNLALLLARIGLGAILLLHGTRRWQAGVGAQVDYLRQFDTPYARVAAWGSITFELVGGICLLLGALVALVGLGVLVQQVLTVCWTSYYRGPDLLNLDGSYAGGFEYSVALALLGLLFAVLGGGVVSLDQLFRRRPSPVGTDEPSSAPERVAA